METKKEQTRTERVVNFFTNSGISASQLIEDLEIYQSDFSKITNGKKEVGTSICYKLACKYGINPRWIEFGEEPIYIFSPEQTTQNNANNGNGTQINNINGDNNVNMTMPKEAWEMLQSQQKTIESQQNSVQMAQANMMELIKAFNK